MIFFVISYPHVFEPRRQFSLLSYVVGGFAVYKDSEDLNVIVQACLILTHRTPRRTLSQLEIWHFLIIGISRNVCLCTFNRYRVITQFAKHAAGEQLCRRCVHR